MAAPAAFARRQFPGAAADTTIVAGINNSVTSLDLASASGWPTGSYTGGILCELYATATGATLEKVWATALASVTLTIVRAADGTSAVSHSAGTGIRPVAGARDADEANLAVSELLAKATTAGQLLYASAAQTYTALAIGASARILVSSGSAPTWQAVSGDITINSSGVTAIGASKVTNAMMADDAIDSAEIADGAIDTVHIAASQITQALMADDAVGLPELVASAKPRWSVPFSLLATSIVTATQMNRGASDTSSQNAIPYVAPEAGAIIGLSVALTTARSGGSLTFEVYKNGVGTGLTAVIDDDPVQYQFTTQAETADSFAAGDRIDIRATTSSFAPTSSNVAVADVLLQAV
jgi:hypothetical protein